MPDVETNREGTSAYVFDALSQTLYRVGTGLGNSVRGALFAKATANDMQIVDLGLNNRASIAVVDDNYVYVLSHSGKQQSLVKLDGSKLIRKVCPHDDV